ncbi:MauE/DoxX family redox-associated membrane protein [Allomuricauda taeanensis]|uniref:MauE/DoxX family redox-associated membrane protein n=1 Tax=Flagellimonas taeanensis TaxID=1005926 RepID=UPI002E7C2F0C|nr:MauE/DoxX family redox-associated membrane protein [Allomuricauda taeanensis]MEE1963960.1 MauE/DoxX family redox-associated membrane protein [Allomuricauda taeanensis]
MKWNEKHKNLIVGAIGLLFVVLFVYTASSKLIDLELFHTRLERMPFISPYAQWISWIIPFMELVIAGLLLFKKYRHIGLYASLVLLAMFTAYIITVLQFSDHVPCSCGGVLSAMGWDDHILFNGFFMALALTAINLNIKQTKSANDIQNTT